MSVAGRQSTLARFPNLTAKVWQERSFPRPVIRWRKRLELNFLQRVCSPRIWSWLLCSISSEASSAVEPLDARYRLIDHAREPGPIPIFPTLPQAAFRFVDRKPGAISVGLFRSAEPQHLAEMSAYGRRFCGKFCGTPRVGPPPAKILGERCFFDPAMNSSFLEGFKRRRLSVGQPALGAAFGEGPASATAGLDQKEFDRSAAHPIANRGDLFALAGFAKLRQSNALRQWLLNPS